MKCFETDLNEHQVNSYLQRISNYLMMNGGFIHNPGLFSGEMGLALFFARYAVIKQNDLYSEYSFELIEIVQNSIHQGTTIDYQYGLTGIGSAIEYLSKFKYVKSDTDDILEEFDDRIIYDDQITQFSIDKLLGIGYYTLWRIAGGSNKTDMILEKTLPTLVRLINEMNTGLDRKYQIIEFLKELTRNHFSSDCERREALQHVCSQWLVSSCRNRNDVFRGFFEKYLELIKKNDLFDNKALDLGLQNGLAGFGMALMTELDGDDSWISLLPNDLIQLKNEPLPL